jgi:hypothetical protein
MFTITTTGPKSTRMDQNLSCILHIVNYDDKVSNEVLCHWGEPMGNYLLSATFSAGKEDAEALQALIRQFEKECNLRISMVLETRLWPDTGSSSDLFIPLANDEITDGPLD